MTNAPARIAIVDDDARLLDSLSELFRTEGLSVIGFASGGALLESDVLATIDCLVTDVSMPGLDGFELQRLVRTRRPELAVIVMSGRHELVEAHLSEAPPGTRIFRKPFSGIAMLDAVLDALRQGNRP